MNDFLIQSLIDGRKASGLSQKDVGDKLGVKQSTISGYESGRREPDVDTLIQLFVLYGMDYKVIIEKAYSETLHGQGYTLSPSEMKLITCFRQLPAWLKESVLEFMQDFLDHQEN